MIIYLFKKTESFISRDSKFQVDLYARTVCEEFLRVDRNQTCCVGK